MILLKMPIYLSLFHLTTNAHHFEIFYWGGLSNYFTESICLPNLDLSSQNTQSMPTYQISIPASKCRK